MLMFSWGGLLQNNNLECTHGYHAGKNCWQHPKIDVELNILKINIFKQDFTENVIMLLNLDIIYTNHAKHENILHQLKIMLKWTINLYRYDMTWIKI